MQAKHLLIAVLLGALAACGGKTPSDTSTAFPYPLNDTGATYCRGEDGSQTDCSTAPRQDGNQGRDAFARAGELKKAGGGVNGLDLTKLDAQGKALAVQGELWQDDGSTEDGTQWACVRDNHTGLVWEVKSTQAGALNHKDWLYQWHDPDPQTNGGNPGQAGEELCGQTLCNTHAYVTAVNSQALCGITSWRLPTVNELLSLVVSDHLNLATDTHYFPHAQPSHYWSAQSYAPDRSRAWYLYLSDGSSSSTLKSKPMYLRLVHRAPDEP